MNEFLLDPKLEEDTHFLTHLDNNTLLLNRNAHFYWLILVPHTEVTEFFQLHTAQQQEVLILINKLSECLMQHFQIDKLNVATLGNVVSQLHIHVIGRRHDDICWPKPIWETTEFKAYDDKEVEAIKTLIMSAIE